MLEAAEEGGRVGRRERGDEGCDTNNQNDILYKMQAVTMTLTKYKICFSWLKWHEPLGEITNIKLYLSFVAKYGRVAVLWPDMVLVSLV